MPELKASAFFDRDGDKHSASKWKLATDKSCIKNIVWECEETNSKLTELTVPKGILKNDTVYYWRVKYQDNTGRFSEWSEPTNFKTKEGKTIAANSVNKAQASTSKPQTPTRKSMIWPVIGGVVILIVIIVVILRIRDR